MIKSITNHSQSEEDVGGVSLQVHLCLMLSQFAYLYYVLNVCTLFVYKIYILLSM